ncbi:tRNA (guanine-N(1)-)-methyltransferase [Fukomys damarensis]|uniref:tRNA (Guanine-N(1)-)-methyltransferase n=1 Tax=Fukomys damarensis TaxID=885580 RepID=A0A091CU00_FUKDA|nr:tRNA (guanine-N(1)-)-methyltransferase [Fukomys damarensis]
MISSSVNLDYGPIIEEGQIGFRGTSRKMDEKKMSNVLIVHVYSMEDPFWLSGQPEMGRNQFELLERRRLAGLYVLNVSPQISKYNLEFTHENFKSEGILRAMLPEGQDVISGFSRVGHIEHLHLRDHQLPFKHLIGQVMIDKNPGITSAVNKINNTDNTYRNFEMELPPREEDMMAKV